MLSPFSLPSQRESMRYQRRARYGISGFPPTTKDGPASIPSCCFLLRASDFIKNIGPPGYSPLIGHTAPVYSGTNDVIGNFPFVAGSGTAPAAKVGSLSMLGTKDVAHPEMDIRDACLSQAVGPVPVTSVYPSGGGGAKAFSYMLVINANSVVPSQRIVTIGNTATALLALELIGGILYVSTAQTPGTGTSTTIKIPSNRNICIIVTSGTNNINVYVDYVQNVVALSPKSNGNSSKGMVISDSSSPFQGTAYEVALFRNELISYEIDNLMKYAQDKYGTGTATTIGGMTGNPVGRVIFDGDSVTNGHLSTNGGFVYRVGVNPSWHTYNLGVSGQLLTTMITNQATPNAWANSTNWLNVQAGINDLAGGATGAAVEANFNTYCTAAISAGFSKANISVETISIAQTAYVTERDNFNTALRANYTGYAGWLFDVAADTVLGCTPASGLITPSLFGDSLHPNDAGHMAKAVLYRSTIGSSLPW